MQAAGGVFEITRNKVHASWLTVEITAATLLKLLYLYRMHCNHNVDHIAAIFSWMHSITEKWEGSSI